MDDEEHILNMIGRMVSDMGYKHHLAKDGNQAVEMYLAAFTCPS